MSIDQLGRVIVGSGHFVERTPGMIEMTTRISVGGGHFGANIGRIADGVVQLAIDADKAVGKIFQVVTNPGKHPAQGQTYSVISKGREAADERTADNAPRFVDNEKNDRSPDPNPKGEFESAAERAYRGPNDPIWNFTPDRDK